MQPENISAFEEDINIELQCKASGSPQPKVLVATFYIFIPYYLYGKNGVWIWVAYQYEFICCIHTNAKNFTMYVV